MWCSTGNYCHYFRPSFILIVYKRFTQLSMSLATENTSITFASNSVEEINECINSDLEEIRLWLAANKLTLKLTKTEILLIGSRQRLSNLPENPSIKINQIPVEQVSTTKSLGVYIDQNLNWEFQIKDISKKIVSGVSAIKRIRDFVPREILLTVYNSLIQPHFDYCRVGWGCCSMGLSQKLQKLQTRAARIITFSNYDRNTDELLHSLNWHKLEHQRAASKSIMMYNAVNNQTLNLSSRFSRVMKPSVTISGILKESYPYHSRALIIVNEVLATAGLCYGIAYRMK